MNKFFTIPNIISILRVILLTPLAFYYYYSGQNLEAVITVLIFGLSDLLDGFIARRFNMVSKWGVHLDSWGDSIFLTAIVILLLSIGQISWPIFALVSAQRLYRLYVTLYFWFRFKGYYLPRNMKFFTEMIICIVLIIPLIKEYFGELNAELISQLMIYGFLLPFIYISNSALKRAEEGKIKIEKF